MVLTREQAEEEFLAHVGDLAEALAQEGERLDRHTEWQSYLQTRINARQLRPEAMHWPTPRPSRTPVADETVSMARSKG